MKKSVEISEDACLSNEPPYCQSLYTALDCEQISQFLWKWYGSPRLSKCQKIHANMFSGKQVLSNFPHLNYGKTNSLQNSVNCKVHV